MYLLLGVSALVLVALIRPALLPTGRPHEPRNNPSVLSAQHATKTLWQQVQNYSRYLVQKTTRHGLLLAVMVSATVAGMVTFLGAWLVSVFGMSVAMIGLVFMVTGGASVVGAFGGGWLADRLGKRRIIALSSIILATILFLVSAVQNHTGVFFFCATGGLAIALREGPFQALISELAPASERGAYIALRNATSQLVIAAAVAICGFLFERFGFHAVAYFAAGCSVAASGLAWWIPEPQR
jgi:putative MFS transporter